MLDNDSNGHPDSHGWGWVGVANPHDDTEHVAQSPTGSDDDADGHGWDWLDDDGTGPLGLAASFAADTAAEGRLVSIRRRLSEVPLRIWGLGAALMAVAVGVATAGVLTVTGGPTHVAAPALPSPTRAATTSAAPANPACSGLSGGLVTDKDSDQNDVAGTISAFEYAYYVRRDANAAATMLAPQTGITAAGLAAGIATIPAGTQHCVEVTALSPNAADVHLVEVHPDGSRVDYLQVIDVRLPAPVLITNIQKQGDR